MTSMRTSSVRRVHRWGVRIVILRGGRIKLFLQMGKGALHFGMQHKDLKISLF